MDVLVANDDRALIVLTPILDAVRYRVTLWWNDRALMWTCSMAQENGTRLFDGRALRIGENLLGQWLDDRLPPGALIVLDTSGEDLDPDRDAFENGRCHVVYMTLAEVRALRAAALVANAS